MSDAMYAVFADPLCMSTICEMVLGAGGNLHALREVAAPFVNRAGRFSHDALRAEHDKGQYSSKDLRTFAIFNHSRDGVDRKNMIIECFNSYVANDAYVCWEHFFFYRCFDMYRNTSTLDILDYYLPSIARGAIPPRRMCDDVLRIVSAVAHAFANPKGVLLAREIAWVAAICYHATNKLDDPREYVRKYSGAAVLIYNNMSSFRLHELSWNAGYGLLACGNKDPDLINLELRALKACGCEYAVTQVMDEADVCEIVPPVPIWLYGKHIVSSTRQYA